MAQECAIDRMSLLMGYAGVYSSFLRHAERAAAQYGISGAELLLRAAGRKLVGGQEDQLISLAIELAAQA
jgi:4-hydroxy 2-oxovalerate aldolase